MTEKPIREYDRFILRLPDGMREQIVTRAKAHNRSMNAEILTILTAYLDEPGDFEVNALLKELRQIQVQLNAASEMVNALTTRKQSLVEILRHLAPDRYREEAE